MTVFFNKPENSKYAPQNCATVREKVTNNKIDKKKLAIKMLINRNDISHQNLPNDDSEAVRTVIVSSGPNGQWAFISDI